MVGKGFTYYTSKRLGRVPVSAVEEIFGLKIDLNTIEKRTRLKYQTFIKIRRAVNGIL